MTVGARIQELRERRKMSRAALAALLGVHRQTVYRWEIGQGRVDMNDAAEIATALGVTVPTLFRTIG